MKTEPALLYGTAGTLIAAIVGVIVEFGPDLTDSQQTAVLTLAGAILPILAAWLTRQKVWPEASVQRVVREAKEQTRIDLATGLAPQVKARSTRPRKSTS